MAPTYTPTWETFKEALKSIAATGLSEADAKEYLCQEISDRNVGILQRLAPDRRRKLPAQTFKGLLNSARISPADIDWERSLPARQSPAWASSPLISDPRLFLSVAYEVHNVTERTVEQIDVCVADVTRVFCDSERRAAARPVSAQPRRDPGERGTKIIAVKQAILALWPNEKAIGGKYRKIEAWFSDKKIPAPSVRTMQRALSLLDR